MPGPTGMGVFRDRLVALVLALAVLAAAAVMPARGQTFENALAGFTAVSLNDTVAAIGGVAAGGDPLAAQVIEALQAGRLLFGADKKIYIRDPAGNILDAATGKPVAGDVPADLKTVRLNNRIRRTTHAAIGALTLLAADSARRYEAAQAVFKSREAASLPTLETAIAKETNANVKRALAEARAAVLLNKADASEADKIDAVEAIRARGDQDAVGLLSGLPADTPPAVARAAASAVTAITHQLAMWEMAQNAWYGLSLGSVLLLAAIGLAITFGVMGVINMAHGEMVMIGAYTTFVVQELIRSNDPALFGYSLAIALPLAFLETGAIGILIERTIIRFLY